MHQVVAFEFRCEQDLLDLGNRLKLLLHEPRDFVRVDGVLLEFRQVEVEAARARRRHDAAYRRPFLGRGVVDEVDRAFGGHAFGFAAGLLGHGHHAVIGA